MISDASLDCIISVLSNKDYLPISNWFETLGFLYIHRVTGLFYNRAKRMAVKFPQKIDKLLKERFALQKRRVKFLRQYIKEISERLIPTDIEHVFLKGSIFSNVDIFKIYEDGERSSNDIDILVKPNGIGKVSNVLKDLGYIQGVYDEENHRIIPYSRQEIINRRMNRGEVAPFLKLTENFECPFVEVDINFSLGNTPSDNITFLEFMIYNRKKYFYYF